MLVPARNTGYSSPDTPPKALRQKRYKMSGGGAPLGVLAVQRIAACCCPRLHFNKLLCFRASVLVLTYITYLTYHLTRKPISVVKGVLHRNCSGLPPPDFIPSNDQWCNWAPFDDETEANTLLGMLDSAFLFSYAIAMFVAGFVAERCDLRYLLSLGALLSAIFCYLFGLARTYNIHSMGYLLAVQACAGVAQTSGWPGTVAVVGNWFGDTKKGLIFGIWNSHTSLGNILGTLLATRFVDTDWALSFIYPALVMGLVGFVIFLFLAPDPASVGLRIEASPQRHVPTRTRRSQEEDSPSQVIVGDQAASLRPSRHSANTAPQDDADEHTPLVQDTAAKAPTHGTEDAVTLARALAIPGVVEFSLSLFFAKLVSYTFLYWLPVYIKSTTTLSASGAGDLSTLFDVGGIAGAIAAGAVADHTGCPAIVCVSFYLLSAPALFLYQAMGALNATYNVLGLLITGMLVNAPYALITTAVSAELGTHSSLAGNARALATVTAIIDGTGSVGAAVGPLLAGLVSAHVGWKSVFHMLIVCNAAALLLLLRVVRTEMSKLRVLRTAGIRAVRIE